MIPTYRKLLVTTDLSPLGNAAIPHAYAVLAERGGTVVLCHAVEVPGLPNPLYARYSRGRVLSGNEREEFREALLRELEQLVPEEVRTRPVVATEVRVVETQESVHEAISDGAVKRIRPKMMTVMPILMGLLPIMWSHGAGADVMKRIAAPMIRGVVTSFILELRVYPVIFEVWRGRQLVRTGATQTLHEGES